MDKPAKTFAQVAKENLPKDMANALVELEARVTALEPKKVGAPLPPKMPPMPPAGSLSGGKK